MKRRPGRTAPAFALALAALIVFGMTRVAAPAGLIGLIFDEPWAFAAVAAVTSLAGALLLFVRPVELAVARAMAGASRPPDAAEARRLDPLLETVGRRAGVARRRLIVRVLEDPGANAAAGASHLLFVTTGALALPDEHLEAVLAHELGHHRGLHPVLTAVIWWLSLPGEGLAAIYRLLRRAVAALGQRLGALGRLLALPLLALLVAWQVLVMWLYWVADLLASRAARFSEYEADAAAGRWGYAEPLANAYAKLAHAELEPEGRVARLQASHPPIERRIELLRAYAAQDGAGAEREGLAPRHA